MRCEKKKKIMFFYYCSTAAELFVLATLRFLTRLIKTLSVRTQMAAGKPVSAIRNVVLSKVWQLKAAASW